ncbi:MAG: large subunit ribosomal protein L31 [Parcubacteria group bacterium Gr01-1014_29]|nr:MAG: large subunit ribosomal protein L31 [Parcubacteria group bacterium Gr01-1014_29]
MKTDTHPTYYPDATITCACGNIMHIGATKKEMSVEICGACHPFYTGKEKLIDTAGRVEKFKARVAKAKVAREKKKPKKITHPSARKTSKKLTK